MDLRRRIADVHRIHQQATGRPTVTASKLLIETGVSGQSGYQSVTYVRTPVTVEPMLTATDLYTGGDITIFGSWTLIKQEECTSYDTDGRSDPFWENVTFKASDEVTVYTLNDGYTFSIKEFGKNEPSTGMWGFNSATGEISVNGQLLYIVASASTASTLILVQPMQLSEDELELEYVRMTLSKKN